MRLNYSIAVMLGFITCLSSFMLGLGQKDYMLPVLMTVAAVASFILTDYRRVIRLGDWTVNVLVLIIVFLTLGEMIKNRGEDLAFSIARVLVFVEMVLLFREKDPRFCWQILLISLLQVVVATVFQQSLLFGVLLLIYVFAGLCAFVLIFLQRENRYFRRHSFVGTFFDALKSEIAERHDRGKLVRIALVTMITGPLSLVFSFSNTQRRPWETLTDGKSTPRDILRSLFAVFPNDQDGTKNNWQTVDETVVSKAVEEETERSAEAVLSRKKLAPVPDGGSRPFRRQESVEETVGRRFPLLNQRPGFSAGTMVHEGLEGGQGELFRHLVRGTLFALIVAVLLFCFVPRVGRVEFRERTIMFGRDHWASSITPPVGTVGFTEEIKLGSLGTMLPHHREVMTVRFTKCPDREIPRPGNESTEVSYEEIRGASLYFRGVALDFYADGAWQPQKVVNRFAASPFQPEEEWNDQDILRSIQNAVVTNSFHVLRPGGTVRPSESKKLFFEDAADMVGLHMVVQPLDTKVFFAPWPFFLRGESGVVPLNIRGGRIEEMRPRRRERSMAIYTTAFKHGVQLSVVPCQEYIIEKNLLQIPEQGLNSLKTLADQWDRESRLPRENIIGRASFMERKFLESDQFKYKLGGTVRDYDLDPLEDFIGNNPSGHCEYFAGALALMLRSVGIHSRVIVGFKAYAAGSLNQGYMVRQSDAHAWVEVYLPPESIPDRAAGHYADWWQYGGWLRLDPSPAAAPTLMKSVTFSLTDLNQWIQTMWTELVLNMNSAKQTQWIYEPVRKLFGFMIHQVLDIAFWKSTIAEIGAYYKSLFSETGRTRWRIVDWAFLAAPAVLLSLLVLATWWLGRRLWPVLVRSSMRDRRRKATIEFYVRMEKLLARIGPVRRLGETPLEYVRKTGHGELTIPIVDVYYRVRFGGAELSDEEIVSVRENLDRLEKAILDHGAA